MQIDAYPRSAAYDAQWVIENEMGPNALWLTETVCGHMDLHPGMRVLDMGCGRAMSSIFLAREYGVRVWANDLWIDATDNWRRVQEAGVADLVCPIHAEAHALPYAAEFFDAIVSIDSYQYYGTDDLYLQTAFLPLVRPGGQIGIAVPGVAREGAAGVPDALRQWWVDHMGHVFHSAEWWRRHWEDTQAVEVEHAAMIPGFADLWLRFEEMRQMAGSTNYPSELEMLRANTDGWLGFVAMVARRPADR